MRLGKITFTFHTNQLFLLKYAVYIAFELFGKCIKCNRMHTQTYTRTSTHNHHHIQRGSNVQQTFHEILISLENLIYLNDALCKLKQKNPSIICFVCRLLYVIYIMTYTHIHRAFTHIQQHVYINICMLSVPRAYGNDRCVRGCDSHVPLIWERRKIHVLIRKQRPYPIALQSSVSKVQSICCRSRCLKFLFLYSLACWCCCCYCWTLSLYLSVNF